MKTAGRYVVGTKGTDSLGAAVALAASLSAKAHQTVYVHEVGIGIVFRAEWDGEATSIIDTSKSKEEDEMEIPTARQRHDAAQRAQKLLDEAEALLTGWVLGFDRETVATALEPLHRQLDDVPNVPDMPEPIEV